MATLISFMTFDNTTVNNFKGWAQAIGSAFNAFGWIPSNDAGAANSTINYGTATITNVAITSNVLTLTFSSATNQFAIGQTILLSGLTTNTFLNNQYLFVTSRTNTTLTANFLHADVVSGADTGTITISYGWATVTNPVDDTVTNFPLSGTFRFRGSYVAVTPTFTNLQTTGNQTTITFGTNGHGLDLTYTVGQNLSVAGIVAGTFTWLNSAAGWPILSLTPTTIVVNTVSSPRADIASTPVAAGTAAPAYIGGLLQFSTMDAIIYGGDLYVVSGTNSATAFTNVTPGADTTRWRRVAFEILASNDALSSTNRLYAKWFYGFENLSSAIYPQLQLTVGSATDGIGNITTNNNWGTTGAQFLLPTPNASRYPQTGSALWESNFSGTSGRISALLWRTYSNTSSHTPCSVLNIERSKDNNGNDTDAYWTVVWCSGAGTNAALSSMSLGMQWQQTIFKPGTGGVGVFDNVIKTIQCVTSQSYNNGLCILPVFPMIGYVGNPLLGVVSAKATDVGEGATVNATIYGTTHTYFFSKVGTTGGNSGGGPVYFGYGANLTGTGVAGNAAGIRWE